MFNHKPRISFFQFLPSNQSNARVSKDLLTCSAGTQLVGVQEMDRPIAPMIAEEALESVFGRKVLSRYMERAPKAGVILGVQARAYKWVQPW